MYRLSKIILRLHDLYASAISGLGLSDRVFLTPLRSLATSNDPITICVVCQGNICRSPYAAEKLRQPTQGTGSRTRKIATPSRGLHTTSGKPADPMAVKIAQKRGVDLTSHRTTSIEAEDIASAHLLVVPDVFTYIELLRRYPEAQTKTIYLAAPTLSDGGSLNIADPYGHDGEIFDLCYQQIDQAVACLISLLTINVHASQPLAK